MRPRAEARGNRRRQAGRARRRDGFNEASCRSTREQGALLAGSCPSRASMRPRAEARGNAPLYDGLRLGLNASMRPRAEARGNRAGGSRTWTTSRCFNEASCRSTRKRADARQLPRQRRLASMRPRAEARGNERQFERAAARYDASMRPRAEARGNASVRAAAVRRRRASMRPRAEARGNPFGHDAIDGRYVALQ